MTPELYTGPDRGQFRVMRLTDDTGVKLRVNCRIKDAACFTYLSDLHYTIVGYTIEWWPEFDKPPHEGGQAKIYAPRGRPNATKMYFRMKSSNVPKMLYLEDAIINDFLSTKVLADPMKLNSYTQEAAEQVASAAQWRELALTPYSYRNAVHVTRYETTDSTPLAVVGQGIRLDWKLTGSPEEFTNDTIDNYPFTRERDCYAKMKEYFESKEM